MKQIKRMFLSFPAAFMLVIMFTLWAENANARGKSALLLQQQQTVTGHVTDSSGKGLSGVSVVVKGTAGGVFTNASGDFSINAKDGDVLVISYVGYATKEVAVSGGGSLNIALATQVTDLNDVVVIGYGVQKKSLVTGAIAMVTSQELANKQIMSMDNAMQGLAPGVIVTQTSGAPGSSPNVYIRGVTTINNNSPLYVVDGVVMNGGINYLSPNDIASIEVMKDAASAAIYGTQAANGVVIVTTKKGALNSPMRISYSGQYGLQGPIKKVKMTDATQYAELRNETAINDGDPMIPYPTPTIYGTGTNWQNEIFSDNAIYQNHNLSMSGGSDKSTYYLAAGYRGQQGIVMPSLAYNNQFSLTTNTSFKISKYVQLGENLSYTYQKTNTGQNTNSEYGGPLSDALNLDPLTPVTVSAAYVAANPQTYPSQYIPYLVMAPNGQYYSISPNVGQEMTNPLAYRQMQEGNYSWSHNFVGNGYINVNPIEGLNIHSQFSAKGGFWGSESFSPYYYMNTFNNNTPLNNFQLSQYRDAEHNLTWNWDNYASYGRTIGKHNFEVMIGHSAMRQTGDGVNDTHLQEPATSYQNASFNWSVPSIGTDNNGNTIALTPGGGYENQVYTLESFFGRVNYNFDEKYLFTGIIRRDGSTKFGSDHRWGTFPSAQLGWVVTKEKFFPQNTPLDNLKIRLSYGVVGNDMSLGSFEYESVVASGGNRNTILGNNAYTVGYGPASPPNPDLKWEQTASFDAGFDAVLYHNFTVTFDYYNKKTNGMIMAEPLPDLAGYLSAPMGNIGNMKNSGVELDLGYRKNFGNDFHLNVNGNIAYNKNTITYLGYGVPYLSYGATYAATSYPLTRMQVGHSVGEFFGFQDLGTFKSQAEINSYGYTDANGNFQLYQPNAVPGDLKWWKNPNNPDDGGKGVIGEGDRTFLGDAMPHWTYGLNLNFSWRNLDLGLQTYGVWGNKVFQAYRRRDVDAASTATNPAGAVAGGANYQIEAVNAWTTLNPNSNYPRLTDVDPNGNFTYPSSFYLQSGAFFRIQNLQIGYTLPKAWMNAIKFQSIRIYASVNNLCTLTHYNGYDPEVGGNLGAAATGNAGNAGVDYGIYPQARTYILGLNIGL